ncbi:hypothetical protein BS50DRAFT_672143 [Corynespora cassiicola Philippines]|uniref:MFS general substrate transporter n=1 Tax=Corynespora cassiicola Philippines TaxID=1448308 RepID=A0A2T2P779_CORCC|nr:hypothetical protein BS50DRAFT_672143 [Corynespora cassiicola Philippines]
MTTKREIFDEGGKELEEGYYDEDRISASGRSIARSEKSGNGMPHGRGTDAKENGELMNGHGDGEKHGLENGHANGPLEQRTEDVPPDGGYGWVCVACCALINAHTWGMNSSYGVFLAYYLSNNVFPGATSLEYAFVGGLSISMALIVSPVGTLTTRLYGTRTTLLIGVFFETVSFIGASFATQTWQLFLSQGVCFGWGMGFLFVGSVVITPQWFTTKRSLANGVSAAGSGIGGLIYSLAAQAMIRNISLAWAFRILGIIACVVNTLCSLLIKDRNKQIGSSQLSFDYRLFKKIEFWGLQMFGFLSMLAYVVLLFSLPNYARTVGMTASQGSIIGAVLNLGQGLGRPPIGYFSDSFGRVNMAASMTFLAGLFSLVIWSFATSFGVLVFFAILGGTVAGTFWAVVGPVWTEIMGLRDLPSSMSITWLVLAVPTTFSEAIGLEIVSFNGGSYTGAILFTGFMYIGGAAFLWLVRAWKIGDLEEKAAALGRTTSRDVDPVADEVEMAGLERIPTPAGFKKSPFTLWTAPSPTQTLGHSSPELPPLPSLGVPGGIPRTPSTVARSEKSHNTYYTASWGSPYRNPPPVFNPRRNLSTNPGSDDLEEDPSALQFGLEHLLPPRLEGDNSPGRFNLEHLIPRLEQNQSPNQFNLDHLIPSRLPASTETPTRTPRAAEFPNANPSDEWVRQFLEGRWNREANDWWSDGTADSDSGARSSQERGSPSDRSKNFHKARQNNKTLNQQDFWSHFSKGAKEQLGKMMASKYANPDPAVHSRQGSGNSLRSTLSRSVHADKPQDMQRARSPMPPTESTSQAPTPVNTLQPPPPNQPPRPRKKIMVKGKGCIISIPRDIPRGTPGYPPKPMSAEAVKAKVEQLQRAGYDTRGFGHWGNFNGGDVLPQNRGVWPDESDVRSERTAAPPKVRVANKAVWDDYVNHLMEAKLAALGVSLGGEEEEAPAALSRTASAAQIGLPFSPPLPSSSASSHRIRQGSIVSGGSFPLGPSPGHMSRQSIASPAAFGNPRAAMHMHRHSTFASPASFVQHSASPSGTWSPGNYFGPQSARGGSPALPLSRPDLADVISPSSPFGMRPGQQFPLTPTEKNDLLVQMQQQQQQLQAQLLLQQQQQVLGLRPSSTLAEVPEDEAEEDEHPAMKHATQPGPEIAIPTPRGHRHNISANLEREARDAEYHLEEAIDKQFNEGGDFSTEPEITQSFQPSVPVADASWESSRPILHQPQPHSRAHSLAKPQQSLSFGFAAQQQQQQQQQQPQENPRGESDGARTNISDVTNPSLEEGEIREPSAQHSKAASQVSNSWRDAKFGFNKSGSAMHSKHTSKSSISKLNVEAKEFKFNPAATFSPSTASFSSGFSFAPAVKSPAEIPRSHPNIDGVPSYSTAAPAFTPNVPSFKPGVSEFKPTVETPVFQSAVPASAPEFKPSGSVNGSTSSFGSGFKFTAFTADAPAFNPGGAAFTPSNKTPAPTTFNSKIFGDVNIAESDIVKPAKRSKAIPIVRPDPARTPEKAVEEQDENTEDVDGRITQAEGHQKRARRERSDGDDVPKFALQPILPSQPLAESKQPQASKQDPQVERNVVPEDKENLSPNAERATSKSKSPEPLSLQYPAPATEIPTSQAEEEEAKTPIDDRTPRGSDAETPTVEEAHRRSRRSHGHHSSLSATAKPFEFRPAFGTAGYDFGIHVTKPSIAQSEEFSNTPPPRQPSRSPATTFRPSDDGSFKTALETGRRGRYPDSESLDFDHLGHASFNDIDAVMKHMNEEGSDFGVERDESWEHSSPRRTPHAFSHINLAPQGQMRSDAPSPSPRRLYVPRNISGTPSVNQDPFDDERAGLAYESPVHRLNNASEAPMSDWDDGLLSDGEEKIQMRSKFFDSHVDNLISRLLQNRLTPLERNLEGIHEAIATMADRRARGRRSMSTTERIESDADDEDEDIGNDSHFRNRSPRKDRALEKIRSIMREVLETNQPQVTSLPVPVPEPILPERIRDIVVEALATHQPQAPAVEPEQIRAIVEEAIVSHQHPAPEPVAEPIKPEDIRAIVTDALASHVPQPTTPAVEPVKPDDIRSIVMEAFATHAPQPAPAPAPEQIWPEDLRAIVTEAIAAQQQQAPAAETLKPETIRSIVSEAIVASRPPAINIEPPTDPVQPDMIRSIVAEALASHKPTPTLGAPVDIPQPQIDFSEIYQIVGSLKASIAQTTSHHLQAEDVRELIDDAFKRQNMEISKREESKAIQEREDRIADLEAMLKEATLRFDAESESRRAVEAREVDTARLLKVTEEELTLLREAASDDENKIRALKDECESTHRSLEAFQADDTEVRSKLAKLQAENEELKLKNVALETSEQDFKKKYDGVVAENEALQYTLEEHRHSANKWRNDIQQAHEETDRMRKAIEQSRLQAEEATRVREAMRAKFDKLQQDMIVASGQAAAERAQWQKSDEVHMKKYEVLSARIEAEGRTRERLERELERLEHQEREGMKLRVTLEQTQKHNARLEETIDRIKKEAHDHQRAAERYEREFREAREAAHVEIRRTRVLMEADIDAANNQVNIVRADLESEIARVRAELDNVRLDSDTLKEKHELDLEAAADAKKQAVEEALESKNAAVLEAQQGFERRLEQVSKEHARQLEIAREDKERAEAFHKDQLSLGDSKLEHLHDRVALLEEKLMVAKEAASAAAAAAQNVKTSAPAAHGSPEKISPQALRESIAVLQDQLQARESRIETLEQELAEVDTDAPNKLKERDTEIGWLRELLGVRIDDLNDLINALAQPQFDRDNVRDAAIRIRTNLQMEQSEKERLMTGGQSFPTLATLSNFASPKAVQLAAAFGNWRKGRGEAAQSLSGGPSRNQTPSRAAPASSQSFLSGLMTPPTSNLRRTPDLSSATRPHNLRSNSTSSRGSAGFPSLGKQPVPSTPPLLRKASYDNDAEVERFSESGFYDDESTVDGDVTPIGINFGRQLHDE